MVGIDTVILILLIVIIILLIWSRVMGQSVLDTVIEIKDMVGEFK